MRIIFEFLTISFDIILIDFIQLLQYGQDKNCRKQKMMSVIEPLLKGLHKKWVKSVVKVCFGDFRNFDQFYLQKIPLYAKTFIIKCCKVEARKICNFLI